jgi:hypothetical protein
MAAGVIFMQWDSYAGGADGPPFSADDPLTFNTRQERLHRLAAGDRLWLVSRCPDDGQYDFVDAHGSERDVPAGDPGSGRGDGSLKRPFAWHQERFSLDFLAVLGANAATRYSRTERGLRP